MLVVSNTSGARLETYAIPGERGSGVINMNGAAAHLIKAGEEIIIIAIGEEDIALVTSLDRGVTLLTIAPERTTPETIRRIADAGVILAAGHTAASYDEMRAARAAGLSGVTHLFNAMSQLGHRAPGLVGVALDDPRLASGLIADGFHVDLAAMGVALRAVRRPSTSKN